jgi:hypothetical protein
MFSKFARRLALIQSAGESRYNKGFTDSDLRPLGGRDNGPKLQQSNTATRLWFS